MDRVSSLFALFDKGSRDSISREDMELYFRAVFKVREDG